MQIIYRNLPAKIGSLLVALILTWYVQSNRNITRDIQVRVVPPVLPKNLVFAGKLPSYLKVQLSGPRELMDFPVSDFKILLANANPRPDKKVPFKTVLIPETPGGISAGYQEGVHIRIDRVLIREVPLDPVFVLNLDEKHRPGYFQVIPSTINISGPWEMVEKIERIKTRVIDVKGEEGIFIERVFLEDLPPFTTLAGKQSPDVEFSINILRRDAASVQEMQDVWLENLKPRCGNRISGFELEAEPISAHIRYPIKLRKPRDGEFEVRVFCNIVTDPEKNTPIVIQDIPVRLNDHYRRPEVQILELSSNKIDLKFKKKAALELVKKGAKEFTRPKEK